VDVGFWGGVIPGNAGNLQEMVRAGVPGSALLKPSQGIRRDKEGSIRHSWDCGAQLARTERLERGGPC
jgi:hypothetical protein